MYWISRVENGPRRVNHAAAALDDLIYSFGGYSNAEDYSRLNPIDIDLFNTLTLRWSHLDKDPLSDPQYLVTPFSRYGHTVVVYQRKFYLWGGRNDHSGACHRLFCFDPECGRWSSVRVRGDLIPRGRDGHSACVIGDRMYIFGGFEDLTQQFCGDLFSFDFVCSTWHEHPVRIDDEVPQRRDFHSGTLLNGRMFVFGGRLDEMVSDDNLYDNRLYAFDPRENCWSLVLAQGDIPSGRRSHSAFVHRDHLYIFGGYNSVLSRHFNDLYQFDPLTSIWRCLSPCGISGPVARRRQCCVVVKDRMYLFGGTSPLGSSSSLFDLHQMRLYDQSDLFVLDFAPKLKTLCFLFLARRRIELHFGPKTLRDEYQMLTRWTFTRSRSTEQTSG